MPDGNSQQVSTVNQRRNHLKALLEKAAPQFQQALPKHVKLEHLMSVAITAFNRTPKLLQAETSSVLSCIMTCAQLGLLPDGMLGQAYLVPFNQGFGENRKVMCQLIVGYRGLLTLARNSGEIESISAHVVYDGDDFQYEFGLQEQCKHVPSEEAVRGEITHAYAVARFKDGGHCFDVLTRSEIDKIMTASQGYQAAEKEWNGKPAKQDSPWHRHYAEMARKTAIRRIAKYLPLSVQKAISLEDAYEQGATATLDMGGDVIIQDPEDNEVPEDVPESKDGAALDAVADEPEGDESQESAEATEDNPSANDDDFPGDRD